MSWKAEIVGKAWCFGANLDTDQILPGYAMDASREDLGKYAMAGSEIKDFASKITKGDIIVAGKNFGCGSSREQAPVALKEAGVSLVIAESFARIFRRNAINIGLPVLIGNLDGLVENNDLLKVDIKQGIVTVVSTGDELQCQKLAPNVLEIVEAGGLIEKVRKELGIA